MGFWDKHLGTPPAPAAPLPPPPVFSPTGQNLYQQVNPGLPSIPQQKPTVTSDNFLEAAEQYQGGEGSRNSGRCPNCGSGNYFAIQGSIVSQNGMASAPPRCYDCNFVPGRTSQGLPPT
jgi:hypothetical protein